MLIATLIVLACALLMMVIEAKQPGRSFPPIAHWYARAAMLSAFQALSVLTIGHLAEDLIQGYRPWAFPWNDSVIAVVGGFLVHTFVFYGWHRWRHASPFLWRWVHQVHHSPRRVEVATSFYKHPLESALNALLAALVLFGLVGLSPQDAASVKLLAGLAELFLHWNVRTPHWLGYIIQRPEAHCVHHEERLHAFNYSELPLVDWLFGTYRNPESWHKTCGLGAGKEERLADMLLGVDVCRPRKNRP